VRFRFPTFSFQRIFYALMYFRRPPWDTGISPPELMEHIATHPPGRALDLGCGTGTNALTLAEHGWQVTAVDFIPRALQQARRKARQAGVIVDFHLDDVTRLDGIRGPFDLALDIGCFHSLAPSGRQAYLQNLERLLAPGGVFLVYAFLRAADDPGSPGLTEAEIAAISSRLEPVNRLNSTERGRVPSAWLTWRKRETP
jgi:cyclopropane fatty-acyl-phospholipid synthase-like methyltransferase